jgi:hypothetical protein
MILKYHIITGVVDSSGIQFFYTSEPPQFEAGILNLGHLIFNNLMVIPPRTERYDIIGKCTPECTSQVDIAINNCLNTSPSKCI